MTQTSWAGHAETHISAVFFAGDLAFKVLKPIETPFLDYSTLEKRKVAVDEEVRLNRRLAPDVYLGVTPLEADGGAIEHAIVMRRMPDDRRLSSLVDAPNFNDLLRGVARKVAAFHESLPPDDEAGEIASLEGERGRWHDNLNELAVLAGGVGLAEDVLACIRESADTYLSSRNDLFIERATRGLCRDGHGDLLAQDIFCLEDGPRILDCLAFSTELRKGDVLADIAFLVMDIERLAGARSAQRLLRWYQEFSNEHHPASLAHFYVAYRALVRAKVNAMRFVQTGDPHDKFEADELLSLCLMHLQRARPRLVLVGGGPGTGKSTIAEAIGQVMGWIVLSSDEIRKERAGHDPTTHQFAEPDEGLYKPEVTADTYAEMCAEAAELLRRGESVVLDASWSLAEHRAGARATGENAAADVIELECHVEPAIAKERIVRRLASPWTVSDATPEIVDHLRANHDPWPEATALETDCPIGRSRSAAISAVLGLASESKHCVGVETSPRGRIGAAIAGVPAWPSSEPSSGGAN